MSNTWQTLAFKTWSVKEVKYRLKYLSEGRYHNVTLNYWFCSYFQSDFLQKSYSAPRKETYNSIFTLPSRARAAGRPGFRATTASSKAHQTTPHPFYTYASDPSLVFESLARRAGKCICFHLELAEWHLKLSHRRSLEKIIASLPVRWATFKYHFGLFFALNWV